MIVSKTYHITQHRVFVPDNDLVTVGLCMMAGGDPYAPSVNDEGTPAHQQLFNYISAIHTLVPAGPGVRRVQTAGSTHVESLLHYMRDIRGTGMFGVLDAFTIEHVAQYGNGVTAVFNPTKHITLTIGIAAYPTPLSLYGTTTAHGSSLMTTWAHSDTAFDPDTCMRDVAKDLLLADIAKPASYDHMVADTASIIALAGPSHAPALHGLNLPVADHVDDADPIWSVAGYTAGDDYAADMAYAPYTTRAVARTFTFDV